MAGRPFTQGLCIVVPEVSGLFHGKILFLIGVKVFFHLLYNMFSFVEIVYFKVRGGFYHLMCMPALVTEFPFLEMVHVRKGTAGGAPDDKVHGNEVMRLVLLKRFRQLLEKM